jgi:hypothetical protein
MCDSPDYDSSSVVDHRWQRSKQERTCCACRAPAIKRGDLYHVTASLYDGHWTTYRHCARCWAIAEHLWSNGAEAIDIHLDCGESYDAPPSDPGHAIAFMTGAEAQAWAATRRADPTPKGTWYAS